MWEFLTEHFPDILLAIEILVFSFYQKPLNIKTRKNKAIAKQEKKVARDYEKLKVDEAILSEIKKESDE